MRFDPDAYTLLSVFIGFGLFLGAGYYGTGWRIFIVLLCLVLMLVVFTLFFFRDPERTAPEDSDAAVSAADGVVVDVSRIEGDAFGGTEALRIAVFMNVFNVHVNRSPLAGRVVKTRHSPGKKLPAFNKRAEYENEYGEMDIETPFGRVRVRQIAGLIARRVVTRVTEGAILEKGDRLGIIRFGSRVDVLLPTLFHAAVAPGDHVRAGETVIARKRLH